MSNPKTSFIFILLIICNAESFSSKASGPSKIDLIYQSAFGVIYESFVAKSELYPMRRVSNTDPAIYASWSKIDKESVYGFNLWAVDQKATAKTKKSFIKIAKKALAWCYIGSTVEINRKLQRIAALNWLFQPGDTEFKLDDVNMRWSGSEGMNIGELQGTGLTISWKSKNVRKRCAF